VAEGYVNHLIVSSEPLQGDNIWTSMASGDIVAIDSHMRFYTSLGSGPATATTPCG
jgi:predicted glutamine amidotransferase